MTLRLLVVYSDLRVQAETELQPDELVLYSGGEWGMRIKCVYTGCARYKLQCHGKACTVMLVWLTTC